MAVLNLQENLELFVLFLRYSLEWVVIETRKKFLNGDIKGFRVYCCDDLNGVLWAEKLCYPFACPVYITLEYISAGQTMGAYCKLEQAQYSIF